MAYPYGIGSIVYYDGENVQVYVDSTAPNKQLRGYSEALLISGYTARLCSTVKRDQNALNSLKIVMRDPDTLDEAIDSLLQDYQDFYKLHRINVKAGLLQQKHDKECSFTFMFDGSGAYQTQFRPRGFGILGRNIESGSIGACLLSIEFILKDKNSSLSKKEITSVLKETYEEVIISKKSNIRREVEIVQKVAGKFLT